MALGLRSRRIMLHESDAVREESDRCLICLLILLPGWIRGKPVPGIVDLTCPENSPIEHPERCIAPGCRPFFAYKGAGRDLVESPTSPRPYSPRMA